MDVNEFSDKLREIDIDSVQFSNDVEFMKDVQLIIDENYINEIFLQLFHSQQKFSLRQILLSLLDSESSLLVSAGKMAINAFLTTGLWS